MLRPRHIGLIAVLVLLIVVVFVIKPASGGGGGGGQAIEGQNQLTPVVPTISIVNCLNDSIVCDNGGSGRLDLSVPTATPQPTATPGAGGGFIQNSGMPIPFNVTPTAAAIWGIPNVNFHETGTGFNDADDTVYEPWDTEEDITINRVSFEVTGDNVDVNCRFGLYDVDEHWQPVNLIHDFGNMSIGSTAGIFHLNGDWPTPAGDYVTAWLCGALPGVGRFVGDSDITKTGDVSTAFTIFRKIWNADTPSIAPGTPFPATAAAGDKWDDWELLSTGGYTYSVMFRWSVD